MTSYVTFGFTHTHIINGNVFDSGCVAVIDSTSEKEGREKAFFYFDEKFSFEFFDKQPDMEFFPRGLIRVEDVNIKLTLELKQKLLLVSKITMIEVNDHVNKAVDMYLLMGMLPKHDQNTIMAMVGYSWGDDNENH